jgi:hypothetical protein
VQGTATTSARHLSAASGVTSISLLTLCNACSQGRVSLDCPSGTRKTQHQLFDVLLPVPLEAGRVAGGDSPSGLNRRPCLQFAAFAALWRADCPPSGLACLLRWGFGRGISLLLAVGVAACPHGAAVDRVWTTCCQGVDSAAVHPLSMGCPHGPKGCPQLMQCMRFKRPWLGSVALYRLGGARLPPSPRKTPPGAF